MSFMEYAQSRMVLDAVQGKPRVRGGPSSPWMHYMMDPYCPRPEDCPQPQAPTASIPVTVSASSPSPIGNAVACQEPAVPEVPAISMLTDGADQMRPFSSSSDRSFNEHEAIRAMLRTLGVRSLGRMDMGLQLDEQPKLQAIRGLVCERLQAAVEPELDEFSDMFNLLGLGSPEDGDDQ